MTYRSATEALILEPMTWGQRLAAPLKVWVWIPLFYKMWRRRRLMADHRRHMLDAGWTYRNGVFESWMSAKDVAKLFDRPA